MNKIKLALIMSLAAILLVLPLFAACAKPAPAEEKVIKVGGSYSLTGPFAVDSLMCLEGLQDYVRYANEQKFLGDVKLEVIWADNKYEVPVGIAQLEEQAAAGLMVNHSTATAIGTAIKERMVELNMPCTEMGSPSVYLREPTTFFIAFSMTTDGGAAICDYFMENWKEDRAPRFAFFTMDNAAGRSIEVPGLVNYIESKGFEIVGSQYYPCPLTSPPTTQLTWLKKQGVDLTFGSSVTVAAAPCMKEANRLGMGPKKEYKITFGWAGLFPGTNQVIALGEETNNSLGAGVWVPPFDSDLPGMKLLKSLFEKYRPDKSYADRRAPYVYGIVHGMMIADACKRALDKVGYEKLTRKDILEGFYGIKNLDTGGLTETPVTFGLGNHYGPSKVSVYEMVGTEQVLRGSYPAQRIAK